MRQRGRKSAEAQASVVTAAVFPPQPLPPPDDLTAEEAVEWRAIVGALPTDWFNSGSLPTLRELCRHICLSRQVATELRVLAGKSLQDSKTFSEFRRLTRLHLQQSNKIAGLSTKLRLTPQSRYDPAKAARHSAGFAVPKPWDLD
jgi:hypothetical protein